MVPRERRLELIEPFCHKDGNGRPPYPLETMLRIYLQSWFALIDQAMEKAPFEIISQQWFAFGH